MGSKTRRSYYDLEGRLAEVIAAVTVMAAAEDSEGRLKTWTDKLSRPTDDGLDQQARWQTVFEGHPEFFLVYEHQGEKKVALRLRYANKTIDRNTGQPYPGLHELGDDQRRKLDLISLPLDAQATSTLINIAVSLNQATLARRADARFFYQTFGPAILALLGVLLGVLGPALIKAI
jgi:hypothetical protein